MAQYLLSVHGVEGEPMPSEEEMELAFKQVDELNQELQSSGVWVFAGGLEPPNTASVVRGKGDTAVTTDGPFAESREHLGGFWIIDVEDLDAALAWASKATVACANPVEVQPFADFSDVAPTADALPEFLLSVHVVEGQPGPRMTDEERQESWKQMQAMEAEMQSTGAWMFSARLAGPDTATVVRSRDGETVVTDGPFAESKEHLAGFYIIGADDKDAALDWGRRVTACVGAPIEVRPFQVEPAD